MSVVKLSSEEEDVIEAAIMELGRIRDRMEWLSRAEFFDEAMKGRETESVSKDVDRIARTLFNKLCGDGVCVTCGRAWYSGEDSPD